MNNEEVRMRQKTVDNISEELIAAEAATDDNQVDGVPVEESVYLDITDDMYCGSLNHEIIAEFTCMLCCGIVYEPIKCT